MARPGEGDSKWSGDMTEEVRRVPLSVRTSPQLRARVELASRKSGRSMAQEIEYRLEQSFADEQRISLIEWQNEFINRVIGAIGDGETGDLLMKLARGIAGVETAQGMKWCHPDASLSAYDMNLRDVMEGIRRVHFKRSEATMTDFIALEYPLLVNDPPKMKD